jgi:hypothetical protein
MTTPGRARITKENVESLVHFFRKLANLKSSEIVVPTEALRLEVECRPVIYELMHCLNQNNFVQSFDWPTWQGEAEQFYENKKPIEMADLDTCVKLLTTHVRKDRFCSGHFGEMVKAGHIQKILTRLDTLRDSIEP